MDGIKRSSNNTASLQISNQTHAKYWLEAFKNKPLLIIKKLKNILSKLCNQESYKLLISIFNSDKYRDLTEENKIKVLDTLLIAKFDNTQLETISKLVIRNIVKDDPNSKKIMDYCTKDAVIHEKLKNKPGKMMSFLIGVTSNPDFILESIYHFSINELEIDKEKFVSNLIKSCKKEYPNSASKIIFLEKSYLYKIIEKEELIKLALENDEEYTFLIFNQIGKEKKEVGPILEYALKKNPKKTIDKLFIYNNFSKLSSKECHGLLIDALKNHSKILLQKKINSFLNIFGGLDSKKLTDFITKAFSICPELIVKNLSGLYLEKLEANVAIEIIKKCINSNSENSIKNIEKSSLDELSNKQISDLIIYAFNKNSKATLNNIHNFNLAKLSLEEILFIESKINKIDSETNKLLSLLLRCKDFTEDDNYIINSFKEHLNHVKLVETIIEIYDENSKKKIELPLVIISKSLIELFNKTSFNSNMHAKAIKYVAENNYKEPKKIEKIFKFIIIPEDIKLLQVQYTKPNEEKKYYVFSNSKLEIKEKSEYDNKILIPILEKIKYKEAELQEFNNSLNTLVLHINEINFDNKIFKKGLPLKHKEKEIEVEIFKKAIKDTGKVKIISSAINNIIKFLDFDKVIGRKQFGSHKDTLDIHLLKTLREISQLVSNKVLSKRDNKHYLRLLFITALVHESLKSEGIKEKVHLKKSAANFRVLALKFGFSVKDTQLVYSAIKGHHWVEELIKKKNGVTPESVASKFLHKKVFKFLTLLSLADIKASGFDKYSENHQKCKLAVKELRNQVLANRVRLPQTNLKELINDKFCKSFKIKHNNKEINVYVLPKTEKDTYFLFHGYRKLGHTIKMLNKPEAVISCSLNKINNDDNFKFPVFSGFEKTNTLLWFNRISPKDVLAYHNEDVGSDFGKSKKVIPNYFFGSEKIYGHKGNVFLDLFIDEVQKNKDLKNYLKIMLGKKDYSFLDYKDNKDEKIKKKYRKKLFQKLKLTLKQVGNEKIKAIYYEIVDKLLKTKEWNEVVVKVPFENVNLLNKVDKKIFSKIYSKKGKAAKNSIYNYLNSDTNTSEMLSHPKIKNILLIPDNS